jgi:TnpA family transposase
MPVDFLTNEQQRRYGCYKEAPSPAQLTRYFYLDAFDKQLINQRRGEHNRLGFALQLGTVRFLSTFLPDPTSIPNNVIAYLAKQLDISDPNCLAYYKTKNRAHWQHANEIRKQYGYRDFNDQPEHFRLVRWLYTRAWLSAERPSMLFDLATTWLVQRKIILPGVTTLIRLIAQVRDRSTNRLWQMLANSTDTEQCLRLEGLLCVAEGARYSALERLRNGPTRISSPALIDAINRFVELRSLRIDQLKIAQLPPNRLTALGRYAATVRAQTIERMPQDRRIATLVAFAYTFQTIALDDALDLLDLLVTDIVAQARSIGEKQRLRTVRDLDTAALQLAKAITVVLDDKCSNMEVRPSIFKRISRKNLIQAAATVESLARPADDNYYPELIDRYRRVRQFLPILLRTITFEGNASGQPLLQAMKFLTTAWTQRKPIFTKAPLDVVPRAWRRLVIGPSKSIERRAYTLCVTEQLQDSLRRRDIFVPESEKWGDPRIKLLKGVELERVKPQICRSLERSTDPEKELSLLAHYLDEAYQRAAAKLPANESVRIEEKNHKAKLILTGLDKSEEPPSLVKLREQIDKLLPSVDLTEMMLEIAIRTRFTDEFTHISENNTRIDDLMISLCAVLTAEACNLGLEPVIRDDVPALRQGRLNWVQQNFIRNETIVRANARLVDEQANLTLAQQWGGGEVASADGLRFVVPVRTINAGPNSKYFGVGRGVTYYNFTSDQFTGFHGIVIPGTLRDSIFILEGLLEQQTSLKPTEIMTDTAGASDIVFGLFWLLGYQFSPRLADIGSTRFWRTDAKADYGVFNGLARHRVNTERIKRNWDDLLRVAGSLKTGKISASQLMRSLLNSNRPSTLARAIADLGRIPKTLYLLNYLTDENYRRRILIQLNRGEGRHSVARAIFHGQRGELRQRYRQGQEDQLGVLGLVTNIVVLWNTIYIEAALNKLRSDGYKIASEDVARLSPLQFKHINFLGHYSFSLEEAITRGQLRPLRTFQESDEVYLP